MSAVNFAPSVPVTSRELASAHIRDLKVKLMFSQPEAMQREIGRRWAAVNPAVKAWFCKSANVEGAADKKFGELSRGERAALMAQREKLRRALKQLEQAF